MRWYSGLIQEVNFQGDIRIVLVPESNDQGSARVEVLGLHEKGASIEGNRFILELAKPDDAPKSTLQCIQSDPPRMRLTYVLDLVLTASDPDGTEVEQVRTKEPAVQSVELTQWPPNGEEFRLQESIDFFFSDDQIATTIYEYPTQERGRAMAPISRPGSTFARIALNQLPPL